MPLATNRSRRDAWLEIDLDAIAHNVAVIRSVVGDRVAMAPVVKADAYGHGLEAVAEMLEPMVEALCVATLDEALALRGAGISGRILLLYPVPAAGVAEAAAARLELTVMSGTDLRHLRDGVAAGTRPLPLHLAVETGMARGGIVPDAIASIAGEIETDSRFESAGLWTHLASADDASASGLQVERFEAAVKALRAAGIGVPPRHIAATDGIFAGTAPALELVRPGLATYGVLEEGLPLHAHTRAAAGELHPAMALKARAAAFSDVPIGGTVGYGGRWRATRPSRLAILPIGYGDGFARGSQPDAEVLWRGRRAPVVGVISMDAIAVDITAGPSPDPDEEFVLLGRQGDQVIGVGELARRRNTIAWEVLSGMAPRLARVYHSSAGTAPTR